MLPSLSANLRTRAKECQGLEIRIFHGIDLQLVQGIHAVLQPAYVFREGLDFASCDLLLRYTGLQVIDDRRQDTRKRQRVRALRETQRK